ncbi:MAG: hypothetical protein KJO07_03195, partial [Deltaproteobacteria bacterium]|nr:hypothetical protein [Deltaproteobacteria bacterium]
TDTAAADALRTAGATLWVAHTEERDIDWLRELGVDGIEWFNIHAAIAPDIRVEHLGLDGTAAVAETLEFNVPAEVMPAPDLAGLPLMFTNEPADRKWTTLLSEGRRISITAGTDAHQNALPIEMNDGERADSYRRMIRWASNFVLVADPSDVMAPERALAEGRSFLAFELFGTPAGFDIYLETSGGVVELGGEAELANAGNLVAVTPRVAALYSGAEPPIIETLIHRVDGNGRTMVGRGTGTVTVAVDGPGAYHATVLITPAHLRPYLGTLTSYAERSYTWVQSNPIYVR